MSRLAHDLFTPPTGEDFTTNPVYIKDVVGQRLVNFAIDRVGYLRGQSQLLNISLTDEPFAYQIQGIGYQNKIQPLISNNQPISTNPALLAVATQDTVSGLQTGQVYVYAQDEPATFPPTFSTLITNAQFLTASKTRFISFLGNMYAFQDNNSTANGTIWGDGSVSNYMGLSAPAEPTLSNGTLATSRTGTVGYCVTYTDKNGVESSPSPYPLTNPLGTGAYNYGTGVGTTLGSANLSLNIVSAVVGTSSLAIIATGVGTSWSGGTTFTISGGTGTSIVSQSNVNTTTQDITINVGSAVGTLTLTDPTTGNIAYFFVLPQQQVINVGSAFLSANMYSSANVYSTLANGNAFYLIGSISWDGATNSLIDSFDDTTVATGTPMPNFGENDPPLPASFGCIHKSRMVLNISGTRSIQISNYNSATQFNSAGILVDPNTGQVTNPNDGVVLTVGTDASDEIMGLCSLGSVLIIFNRLGTYYMLGNDLRDFSIYPALTARGEPVGCISSDSIARCGYASDQIWFLARDGVYSVDGNFNITKVSQPIQDAIDAYTSTPSGILAASDCTAWYSQHKYHVNIPGNSTVYFYDFNQVGPSRWAEYDISELASTTNAALQSACLGIPYNDPTLVFIARSDINQVQMWDVVTTNQTVKGMRWVSRAMQSFLPYRERAAMGEQEIHAGRKRVARLFVFGTGVLTSGGTVTIYCDGRTESYSIPAGTGYDPSQQLLIYQEWTPAMTGRLIYFDLVINGTGVVINDAMMQYIFVG